MYEKMINKRLDRLQQCSQIILNFKKGDWVVPAELYALMKEAQDQLQTIRDQERAYNEKIKADTPV